MREHRGGAPLQTRTQRRIPERVGPARQDRLPRGEVVARGLLTRERDLRVVRVDQRRTRIEHAERIVDDLGRLARHVGILLGRRHAVDRALDDHGSGILGHRVSSRRTGTPLDSTAPRAGRGEAIAVQFKRIVPGPGGCGSLRRGIEAMRRGCGVRKHVSVPSRSSGEPTPPRLHHPPGLVHRVLSGRAARPRHDPFERTDYCGLRPSRDTRQSRMRSASARWLSAGIASPPASRSA